MKKPCYNFNVVSVETSEDITTMTIADDVLAPILTMCDCVDVNFCISTSFEVTRECTRIVVTDGTNTLSLAKRNQYWRPRRLKCNSKLYTELRNDPHLLVFKEGVCHG